MKLGKSENLLHGFILNIIFMLGRFLNLFVEFCTGFHIQWLFQSFHWELFLDLELYFQKTLPYVIIIRNDFFDHELFFIFLLQFFLFESLPLCNFFSYGFINDRRLVCSNRSFFQRHMFLESDVNSFFFQFFKGKIFATWPELKKCILEIVSSFMTDAPNI